MMRNARDVLVTTVSALVLASPGLAQDSRQGAPVEVEPEAPSRVVIPESDPTSPRLSSTVNIGEVKGLIFWPSKVSFDRGEGEHVMHDGVGIVAYRDGDPGAPLDILSSPEFKTIAHKLIGHQAQLSDLNTLARRIVRFYRTKGHPLVDVRIPAEQDIGDGIINVIVTEFRVNDVVIQSLNRDEGQVHMGGSGLRYFSPEHIRAGFRLQKGDRIDQNKVNADLDWLDNNPFRRIDLLYRKAGTPGYTDIVIGVGERRPWRVYGIYDNQGTPSTQRSRIGLGFNLGNLFKREQQFSYQFTASPDILINRKSSGRASFASHSVTYSVPVNGFVAPHGVLSLFGIYQSSSPLLSPVFDITGRNIQGSARYSLFLDPVAGVSRRLGLGYDFKSSNNNVLFGGTNISRTASHIHQLSLDASATRTWALGSPGAAVQGRQTQIRLRLVNNFVWSPGNIDARNTDAAFSGTPFARARYHYNRFEIVPTITFPQQFELQGRAIWQLASGNLLPSEQLSCCGNNFVRGYDTNYANGSRGYFLSGTLMFPPFPFLFSKVGDTARLGAFFDHARVRQIEGAGTSSVAESTGIVMQYSLTRHVQIQGNYAWRLRALGGLPRGSMGFITTVVGF